VVGLATEQAPPPPPAAGVKETRSPAAHTSAHNWATCGVQNGWFTRLHDPPFGKCFQQRRPCAHCLNIPGGWYGACVCVRVARVGAG
jgi:hypothetical protein